MMKRLFTALLLLAFLISFGAGEVPAGSVPEDIQTDSITVTALEELPVYDYEEREIPVDMNGQTIYGIAYIPQGDNTWPVVLCAHGLGGTYQSCAAYAEQLASHGLAAYCFDFRGGGGTRSDGSTTEMSVMTEVADLEAIIAAAKEWDFVDPARILLFGTSQGGIVSAITAARHAEDVAGLILCYPAFVVYDDIHKTFSSLDEVPDSFSYQWITAGRPYIADMWDYDVYAEIGNYQNKVLLMHGDGDSIVPISYADRAAEVYPDVEYFVISGAGHGFNGSAFEEAVTHIFDYVQEIGVLGNRDVQEISADQSVRVTIGDTTGSITLRDNETADAFKEMLPLTIQMNDLNGREYWFSRSMPYADSDVIHDYAPGQLTYWCGGWVTAYYDRDDDSVIEDGSVVFGDMDDSLVAAFHALNGASADVTFELENLS